MYPQDTTTHFISCTSALDANLSTKCYTFESDEESQHLYIIASLGKYENIRLPIGLKCSPDSANAVLENILSGSDAIDVCVDDAGVFSSS